MGGLPLYGLFAALLGPTLKKQGSSHESGLAAMFDRKGVVLADSRGGLDLAETDGIEVGPGQMLNF